MHDIRFIRENAAAFDESLRSRGLEPFSERLVALDERRRSTIAALQAGQERRNALSKEIGEAMRAKDAARAETLKAEVAKLKEDAPALEQAEREAAKELEDALAVIPNLPKAEVPVGRDEHDNVERHRFGKPRNLPQAKQHFEIGEALGLMDFEAAAKLSGSRFVVLRGQIARLERALGQFMLDLHTTEHGYTEVAPPLLVRDEVPYGTGNLPKAAEDMFRTREGLWLVPTAEVPLTNLVREAILDEEALPMRFTALTPCFRSEAGRRRRRTSTSACSPAPRKF
jgi:seryl-tRNA synthetase